jgi:hypothetical protein
MWVLWNATVDPGIPLAPLPAEENGIEFRWLLEDSDYNPNDPAKDNPYNTYFIMHSGTTSYHSTVTSRSLEDERGAEYSDPPDGIPDVFNWASHIHAETFKEANP